MCTIAKTGRIFYGWYIVMGLCVTEIISWGALVYAFSAFLVPMHNSMHWSAAELNGAYALGAIVSGGLALPIGRWLEVHGARLLMTLGSLGGVAMLLLWSKVTSIFGLYAVFVLGGMAMGASLYEPAFATTAAWFERRRFEAVLVLTIFAGLASVIFIPLAGVLITDLGWRKALFVLAMVMLVGCVPIHALVLRNRPSDLGLQPDGGARAPSQEAPARMDGELRRKARKAVLVSRSYRLFVVCLVLVTMGKIAVTVNLVAYLFQRGFSLESATLVSGSIGLAQILGRVLVVKLRRIVPESATGPLLLGAQGASLGLLVLTNGHTGVARAAVAAFAVVFGLGVGLPELLRGTVVADRYGSAIFASVNGSLSMFVVSARAMGPFCAGIGVTLLGGYEAVLIVSGLVILASAVALVLANRCFASEDASGAFVLSFEGP